MLRASLPSSIGIDADIEENTPAVVMNQVQVNRLLMNLFINARDAMEGKGNIAIHLGLTAVAAECAVCNKQVEGDWVQLSIADTGSGVKREILSRIFDPFYSTKDVGRGTGLGLSVVSGIMRGHGGHILVETEAGKGATFRLLFPSVVAKAARIQTTDRPLTDPPRGHGERILVVDDELDLGEIIGEQLQSYGYRATVLANSREALELFEQKPNDFALLITDQTMPEITGIELVRALRQVCPDMPAILNTGFSDDVDADGAVKMGVRYLEKPVDTESLILTVGELLQPTKCRTE